MMPTVMGAAAVNGGLGGGFGSSPPSSSRIAFSQMMFQPNMIDNAPGQLHLVDMAVHHDQATSDGEIPEFESTKSGSDKQEGVFGEEQGPKQPPNKKKRYHRHTQHQIEELEAFFKECPHPDDKQRKELSRELGLEPLQVKFWFQNKRTQMKMHHERSENSQLRAENEKLQMDNIRYKEALSNASCPNCGGPAAVGDMNFDEHHLRMENVRLREEVDRISAIAARYVGRPIVNYPLVSHQTPPEHGVGNYSGQPSAGEEIYIPASDLSRPIPPTDIDKPVIVEMAIAAMEELMSMAQMNEPLWMPSIDGTTNVLNEEEYLRMFPRITGHSDLKSQASKENAIVTMNQINLVEILMDVDQWSTLFCGIVSRAMILEVISTGVARHYNDAIQVMSAEYHVPSPHAPTWESYFVRYCKQHPGGTWAVVDVSLVSLRPSPAKRCQRRPSGCLIKELPNGYSKVTWVEHVEVDDSGVSNLYKPLVDSGLAFGAKRWLATLERQCERLASAMATSIPIGEVGVITSAQGRASILKLAERMMISFCNGVSASKSHTWTTVSGTGSDDVRIMIHKSINDPGRPPGIVLSAATSFWLSVPPKQVFDFLRDETTRSDWDILSSGGLVHEIAHIANSRDTGNCVSLLRVNSANSSQSNMLILQESCTDATGSFVIYAPIDAYAMNIVLNGGDPDFVALLPSGFAILPDGLTVMNAVEGSATSSGAAADHYQDGGSGCLLTVAFQILVDSVPTAKLSLGSVATVNSLIACTVNRIKESIVGEDKT